MITITYVSSSRDAFSDTELAQLLETCRKNNLKAGITGLLLYKDGNFMQALEGPEDAVRLLYSTIVADSRHHGIIKLIEEKIQERAFPEWLMSFQNLNKINAEDFPGYSEFLDNPFTAPLFQETPAAAQRLLLTFRHMYRAGTGRYTPY